MDRQTLYFTVANVRQYVNEEPKMARLYKSQMKISANQGDWRLPSSPIVEQKHKDLLCKFKSVLIYTWSAKPLILPLQMFGNTKMKTKKWPDSIKAK